MVERVVVGDLSPATDWATATSDIDVVIHLAARVHVMRDAADDPLAEFRRINVEGTLNLGRQAAAAGVRRMVYLSSIKVNGDRGVFTETDPPAPTDPYGISKQEAEVGLRRLSAETRMESVIIRPPLVYGPGVKANFQKLMRAIARGMPLPLGAVHNRRSLVGLDNLVDFILTCAEDSAAAGETFLVSDGEDLSTSELIRRLARAMGRPARLIPVPPALLSTAAMALGRGDMAQRLFGSLEADITKARTLLGWTPPVSVNEGLRRATAEARGMLQAEQSSR
jgi:UDP-glucose 4-epimerase